MEDEQDHRRRQGVAHYKGKKQHKGNKNKNKGSYWGRSVYDWNKINKARGKHDRTS